MGCTEFAVRRITRISRGLAPENLTTSRSSEISLTKSFGEPSPVGAAYFESPGADTVIPRSSARSMAFCTRPNALASSTNSLI